MHTTNATHERDSSAWRRAHARCLELAKRAAALDREIGRALLEAERERVFAYLGFAGIIEHGDRIFGLGPRATLERLRVARALEALPALDAALADVELVFRHADGTAYGGATAPPVVEVFTEAFVALRTMGWKEREARAAVDAVRAHVGTGEPPSIEAVLRRCLAELRSATRPAAAPSA